MNLDISKANEFMDFVESLIRLYSSTTGVGVEKFLVELYRYAAEKSEQYIPPRHLEGHRTGVNFTQLDFNIIMMSIVSICWAVRMRKTKSQEGQCWEHTTDCIESRIFHSERYQEWINIIEEALQVLKSNQP
jgi:hypothetical protein